MRGKQVRFSVFVTNLLPNVKIEDTSDLEKSLYEKVLKKIQRLKIDMGTKILVWIIFKEIDDDYYNKESFKVINSKRNKT